MKVLLSLIVAAVIAMSGTASAQNPSNSSREAWPDPAATATRDNVWASHRTAENLNLAVERDGRQYYFSQTDWEALNSVQRAEFRKLGVVINKDGYGFILGLNLEGDGEKMVWQKAVGQYSGQMPTKEQAAAIATQYAAVIQAINSFGGSDADVAFWTSTENDPATGTAWLLSMYNGYLYSQIVEYSNAVRPIMPLSEAR